MTINNFDQSNLIKLVKLITSNIKNREEKKAKWASLRKENHDLIERLIGVSGLNIPNSTSLFGFDIDEERKLILLNYSGQAHNVLHDYLGGWSSELRSMRGLIYSYEKEIKLVSRSFEKFFNSNELPENMINNLFNKFGKDTPYEAREKADGHMIQFFEHNNELLATTRGKFGTASALEALTLLDKNTWNIIKGIYNSSGYKLMTLTAEICTPNTKVFVDYNGKSTLFLLTAYDYQGNKIEDNSLFKNISKISNLFSVPKTKTFTLSEIVKEVQNRNVKNNEGWVINLNGYLVKFKYETYIGMMVNDKLSYKYIMQCIINDRLDKMLMTLPEEVMKSAYEMEVLVKEKLKKVKETNSKNHLYDLWSDKEGSKPYYRTICRNFIKFSFAWRKYDDK